MRHPALLSAALAVAALTLATTPAAAQHYGYPDRDHGQVYGHADGYDRTGWGASSATREWRSQLDRPGDYRCDAFWDANRSDCAAPWRDQRRSSGYGWGDQSYGYGRDYSGYPAAYGHGGHGGAGYSTRRRGYGQATFDSRDGEAWHGAYGRPDLIYSGDDNRSGRDGRRIGWCRATYRSYDPASGYYRAYSGRLVYCG